MNVIDFILEHWDIITLVIAAVAAIVYAVFKGNKSVVMNMLFSLVTEAEKNFGAGTGALKLASVIEQVYPKLPTIIKTFITAETLVKWVEDALVLAKKKFEFSKIILFVFGLIEVGVVLFTCYMVHLTCDLTPLAYLIPSTAIVGATMVKNYYEKAKRENVIKLKKQYGVSLSQEDFTGETY